MNPFVNILTNTTTTENGAKAYKSSLNAVLDMFALGGAYRQRSDGDVMLLFKKAYADDPVYALKCLFYLRDVRGGQGERRFFRVCYKWLAKTDLEAAKRNLPYVPEYGRWDDLIDLIDTDLFPDVVNIVKNQLAQDMESCIFGEKTPVSLLAKWMPSANTSSATSVAKACKLRDALGMTPRQYRKTLATLRARIKVLETLMSAGRWDEIDYEALPSNAGAKYRKAFLRHDPTGYAEFAQSKTAAPKANTLYPYEIVHDALNLLFGNYWYHPNIPLDNPERMLINKTWEAQKDYLGGKEYDILCVVDTSGSMAMGRGKATPMNIAIGLGMYCAERLTGDYKNKFISYSRTPQFVEIEGLDFCDKVVRIYRRNECANTDLIATFELLRRTAVATKGEGLPNKIVVISDMEIDGCGSRNGYDWTGTNAEMEEEALRWEADGLTMPDLVYWNVNARHDTFLQVGDHISYASGASPVLFEQIASGKTGVEMMLDKLDSDRYKAIR